MFAVASLFYTSISVEPIRQSYNVLRGAIASSSFVNYRARQCALGRTEGKTSIYLSRANRESYTANLPTLVESRKVLMKTLDSLVQGTNISGPFLTKVDIQGNRILSSRRRKWQSAEGLCYHRGILAVGNRTFRSWSN